MSRRAHATEDDGGPDGGAATGLQPDDGDAAAAAAPTVPVDSASLVSAVASVLAAADLPISLEQRELAERNLQLQEELKRFGGRILPAIPRWKNMVQTTMGC